jgi:hypothetical protein
VSAEWRASGRAAGRSWADESGNELTILEQFIGNIGRFNPPPEEE